MIMISLYLFLPDSDEDDYEDEYDYDDEEDYHYEDGVVGNVEEPPLSDAAVVGVKRGIKLFSSLLYFLSTQIPGTRYHFLPFKTR